MPGLKKMSNPNVSFSPHCFHVWAIWASVSVKRARTRNYSRSWAWQCFRGENSGKASHLQRPWWWSHWRKSCLLSDCLRIRLALSAQHSICQHCTLWLDSSEELSAGFLRTAVPTTFCTHLLLCLYGWLTPLPAKGDNLACHNHLRSSDW